MSKIFSLQGRIQHYAWGGDSFIPNLLQIEKEDKPYAEYWLGAHVNAPALVDEQEPLDQFIDAEPIGFLGQKIFDQFGRLPFLFKVLDVEDMLSIQVHPSKAEAEKGFTRENEEGIPLTASHRNYKDDNHKPEIMVALSDFWLLHGFLPEESLAKVLSDTSELADLLPTFQSAGYKGLYKKVMEESADETNQRLRPLVERIAPLYKSDELLKSSPDYWAAKAARASESGTDLDKGIYSIYFFNIVNAKPGQAVFQDAGIPHAYLEGQNMELMANSDNVLRGGLTPKHVDVPELLKHVVFEATIPNVMDGESLAYGMEKIYKSPAPDFELSKIELKEGDTYVGNSDTAEVFMAIEGEAELTDGEKSVDLCTGKAGGVMAGCEYQIKSSSSAVIYKATAP